MVGTYCKRNAIEINVTLAFKKKWNFLEAFQNAALMHSPHVLTLVNRSKTLYVQFQMVLGVWSKKVNASMASNVCEYNAFTFYHNNPSTFWNWTERVTLVFEKLITHPLPRALVRGFLLHPLLIEGDGMSLQQRVVNRKLINQLWRELEKICEHFVVTFTSITYAHWFAYNCKIRSCHRFIPQGLYFSHKVLIVWNIIQIFCILHSYMIQNLYTGTCNYIYNLLKIE